MKTIKILAFAGSTRTGSYNKKLIKIAAESAKEAGAEVTLIDLRDFPMPLYDGDLEKEEGIPENGKKFMDILLSHQGLLISSPEYNSSISGVLKNAIDWASRPTPNMKELAAFEHKVACLMSASTGRLGGLRGLIVLRSMLSNIKVIVLPEQLAISKANEAFDENNQLKDPKQKASILKLGTRLVEVVRKLNS